MSEYAFWVSFADLFPSPFLFFDAWFNWFLVGLGNVTIAASSSYCAFSFQWFLDYFLLCFAFFEIIVKSSLALVQPICYSECECLQDISELEKGAKIVKSYPWASLRGGGSNQHCLPNITCARGSRMHSDLCGKE